MFHTIELFLSFIYPFRVIKNACEARFFTNFTYHVNGAFSTTCGKCVLTKLYYYVIFVTCRKHTSGIQEAAS
jgi:hypothetical protein